MTDLGDIAVITDCEHKTAKPCQLMDRFAWSIGTKAIRSGSIVYDQARPVDEVTFKQFAARRVPARGDLILAREAPVGDCVLVPEHRRVCLGQRTVLISPDDREVHSRYLYFLLRSPAVRSWMDVHSSGSTVKHLNVRDIYRIPLGTLPPLEEQERIAGVLGGFDDLIETNRRLAGDLMSLLFARYEMLGREQPKTTFGIVARLIRDQWKPGSDGPDRYLGLEHFATGGAGLVGLGSSSSIQSVSLRFGRGDVLYGKLRPYFRKVARPGFDGLCSSEVWVLRAHEGYPQSLVHALAHAPRFSEVAMAGSGGTRMPRADWKQVSALPVPDLRLSALSSNDQNAMEALWSAACELDHESQDLARQRDELLPLLMSGTVRARDVEASVS